MNVKTLNQPTEALRTGPKDGPQIDYVASILFASTGVEGHRVDVKYHTIPDIFRLPINERLRAINHSPVLLSFVATLNSLKERFPGVPTEEQLAGDRLAARGEKVSRQTTPGSPTDPEMRRRLRGFDTHYHGHATKPQEQRA